MDRIIFVRDRGLLFDLPRRQAGFFISIKKYLFPKRHSDDLSCFTGRHSFFWSISIFLLSEKDFEVRNSILYELLTL